MTTAQAAVLLTVLTSLAGHPCRAQDGMGTPLADSIAELNERVQALDPRITPLTEEELFLAIDEWNRESQPVSDQQLMHFQSLKEVKSLKSDDSLYPRLFWKRDGMEGTTEFLTAIIQLDLMTGEQEGFGFVVRRQQVEKRPYPPTSVGYEWFVRPQPLQTRSYEDNVFGSQIVCSVETEPRLSVMISRTLIAGGLYDVQPVAFDAAGARHTFREVKLGQAGDLRMSKYVLTDEADARQKLESLGVEMLTPFGAQYASRKIVDAAIKEGEKILPLPIVGKPLSFEFTSSDGQTIRSSELLGNIVLIDCWATWCAPCVKQIPALQQFHKQYESSGLKVIGLSFGSDPAEAEAVYESRHVQWPLIHVPADKETRQLWDQSARIISLPRLLVLNTDGLLVTDTDSLPIAVESIQSLLKKAGEQSHALEPATGSVSNGQSTPPAQ